MKIGLDITRIAPLLVAIAVVTALAVPITDVTVQQLGAGVGYVVSPVNVAVVNHVFSVKDGKIVLDAVKIAFDKDLPVGSYIRVELRDYNDSVLASGEITLQSDLSAGTFIIIDVEPDLDVYDIMKYHHIVVVVAGKEVAVVSG